MRLVLSFALLAALVAASLLVPSTGSAQDGSRTESLEGIDSILIDGVGTATVTIGSPAQVVISGPADAVDQINVVFDDDDEVEIRPAPGTGISLGAGEELRYAITLSSLEDLDLRGVVEVTLDGLEASSLDIDMHGATTATLTGVQVNELDVDLRGTALLTIGGTAGNLDLEARDASTFEGRDLVARTAEVETRDAAHARVHVTESLEAEARAASTIDFSGNPPQTNISMREAGAVNPVDATASASPVASPANPEAATQGATQGATHEVAIVDFAFAPATLEIQVGDTVTWTNQDTAPHTATAEDGAFDSGTMAQGASFSHTFSAAGTFPYRCDFHSNMEGTITVVE
jgi:plastocyanin